MYIFPFRQVWWIGMVRDSLSLFFTGDFDQGICSTNSESNLIQLTWELESKNAFNWLDKLSQYRLCEHSVKLQWFRCALSCWNQLQLCCGQNSRFSASFCNEDGIYMMLLSRH